MFPMIPNAHITVYNKYIDAATRSEKYQRAIVYNVVWQAVRAINRFKEQVQANTTLILIPFASGNGYQEPRDWQVDRDGWTLQEGDVIARGMISQDITTEYSVSDLRRDYDVIAVASVASMDEGSPNVQHWEVNGK